MTPATWARTSTRRDAAACPTNSKRAETVSGATVSTVTSGGGGAAVAARRHAQPPCRRAAAPTAQTAVRRERLVRITASGSMDLVPWKYGRDVAAASPRRAFFRVGRLLRFVATAGRSAARLARLVRDQEVGGSNPLAPIDNQMLDSQLGHRAFLLRQAFPNSFPLIVYTITARQTSDFRGCYGDHGEAEK